MNDLEARARRAAALVAFFDKAPMKSTFGMTLSYDETLQAVFEMPFDPKMTHAFRDTHGGVVATLLDNAGWFTAATYYDYWVNTSELTVRLHEPARRDDLIGTGSVLRAGGRFCVATMEVRTPAGRLVASGSGCFVVSSKRIEPTG